MLKQILEIAPQPTETVSSSQTIESGSENVKIISEEAPQMPSKQDNLIVDQIVPNESDDDVVKGEASEEVIDEILDEPISNEHS